MTEHDIETTKQTLEQIHKLIDQDYLLKSFFTTNPNVVEKGNSEFLDEHHALTYLQYFLASWDFSISNLPKMPSEVIPFTKYNGVKIYNILDLQEYGKKLIKDLEKNTKKRKKNEK